MMLWVVVSLSFVNVLIILTSVASPWYKVIDFQSDAASWTCSFSVQRSAFFSWKECDCSPLILPDASLLPAGWCTDSFYEWRKCENCDTLGCAWYVACCPLDGVDLTFKKLSRATYMELDDGVRPPGISLRSSDDTPPLLPNGR